jgi:bacteriorhodopsin
MELFVDSTTIATLVGMGSAFALTAANPIPTGEKCKVTALYREIKQLELVILGTASVQYAVVLADVGQLDVEWLRYIDWLITTPLLLKTVHTLATSLGYSGTFDIALVANFAMIVSGYVASFNDPDGSLVWWTVGMFALFVVLAEVYRWCEFLEERGVDLGTLPLFFYVGWSLYGLNFMNSDSQSKSAVFNFLDLISKAVYAAVLHQVTHRTATVLRTTKHSLL